MGPRALLKSATKKGGWKAALEFTLIPPRPIEESPQSAAPARVPQFPQRFRFDLTDAFARHFKECAHLFECVILAIFQAEAQLKHFAFAVREQV